MYELWFVQNVTWSLHNRCTRDVLAGDKLRLSVGSKWKQKSEYDSSSRNENFSSGHCHNDTTVGILRWIQSSNTITSEVLSTRGRRSVVCHVPTGGDNVLRSEHELSTGIEWTNSHASRFIVLREKSEAHFLTIIYTTTNKMKITKIGQRKIIVLQMRTKSCQPRKNPLSCGGTKFSTKETHQHMMQTKSLKEKLWAMKDWGQSHLRCHRTCHSAMFCGLHKKKSTVVPEGASLWTDCEWGCWIIQAESFKKILSERPETTWNESTNWNHWRRHMFCLTRHCTKGMNTRKAVFWELIWRQVLNSDWFWFKGLQMQHWCLRERTVGNCTHITQLHRPFLTPQPLQTLTL